MDLKKTGSSCCLFRSLTRDPDFADPTGPGMDLPAKIAARRAAVETFMRGLADWVQVEAAMAKVNLAWGRVRRGHDLRDQVTLRHRGSIAQVDDRAGGTRPIPQSPYHFSAASSGVRAGAPHRGEHNGEVLADWLGLDAARVEVLTEGGVLSADPATVG